MLERAGSPSRYRHGVYRLRDNALRSVRDAACDRRGACIRRFFVTYLLKRNSRVEADLVDQLFNSSEKRLARLLLLMANFGKDGGPQTVVTSLSQKTLAELIGTTESRVDFFMNKFRKLGFIEFNGDLTINNSLLNVVLHGDPEIRREKLGTDGEEGG
jgi:hypothetical protein